jgi:hypothetical protein
VAWSSIVPPENTSVEPSPIKSFGDRLPLEKERGSNKLINVNYAKMLDVVKMNTSS